ncbi:hypothetical protein G3I18_15530 [Actinospica acidiphila]|uniref:RHS repeat protein n=1 Tax=Actinospica acidiphila TaxID=304899 RepID=A0A9X5CK00_9ACTN|nr:hypothetical protein [Actinospica acidiphila]NEC49977.1 hypothetical protein [Actinospica acidiphila]
MAYGGTGATRALGYDALDRPTSDTVKAPGGATTVSVAYGYDDASRLTEKTTTSTADAGAQSYGYDWAQRACMLTWPVSGSVYSPW